MIEQMKKEDDFLRGAAASAPRRVAAALRRLDIGTDVTTKKLSPYHSAISVRDNITRVTSNLIDVGYGASQVIPILRACFNRSRGILIVEQPEIHLHPRAQATVAELLCATSRSRQVIVETHSEHMINRARIMVAEGQIPASHVMILFVGRTKQGSQISSIPVLNNGDFGTDWPIGFFDERYQDTMRLVHLKQKGE